MSAKNIISNYPFQYLPTEVQICKGPWWPTATICTFPQVPRSPRPSLAGFPSLLLFPHILVNTNFNSSLDPNPIHHKSALELGPLG